MNAKEQLETMGKELENAVIKRDEAEMALNVIRNSEEYKTMQFIAAFADSDNSVEETELDEKTTVYTLTAFGEEYQIANSNEASLIKRAVNIANMEKR